MDTTLMHRLLVINIVDKRAHNFFPSSRRDVLFSLTAAEPYWLLQPCVDTRRGDDRESRLSRVLCDWSLQDL